MKKKVLPLFIICSFLLAGCGSSKEQFTYDSNSISSETTTVNADSSKDAKSTETAETTESQNDVSYEITYTNAKTWTTRLGARVQVIVEIENTGTTDLYLSSGSCDLEDQDGNLVAVLDTVGAYPNVISPGEKGYMYEEKTLDNYSDNGELTAIVRPDIEESYIPNIRYDVTDVSLNDNQYGTVDVMGRLTCTSTDEESVSYAVVIFYDENHIPIAVNSTSILEDLNPNDKIGFEISGIILPEWITSDAVADYIIYAYPLQHQY